MAHQLDIAPHQEKDVGNTGVYSDASDASHDVSDAAALRARRKYVKTAVHVLDKTLIVPGSTSLSFHCCSSAF